MMNQFSVQPEEKAFKAFLDWLDEGKKLWATFEQNGIPVPSILKRVLTDEKHGSGKHQPRPTPTRAPERPEVPQKAGDDWLWIEAKEASVSTVVLAILNEGKPILTKTLIERVKQVLHDKVNEGSIYNIVSKEKRIQRTDQGLELEKGTETPILYKNYLWAPRRLFQKQDLAAFRRMAVCHLLAISIDGLQLMQIFRQLKTADWLRTPLSKDLIKADLFVMQEEKKVKRLGHSKKWTLTNLNES